MPVSLCIKKNNLYEVAMSTYRPIACRSTSGGLSLVTVATRDLGGHLGFFFLEDLCVFDSLVPVCYVP